MPYRSNTAEYAAGKSRTKRPRTIEQLLTKAGLGHRRDSNSLNDGRHVVFVKATGHVLGRFDALDAAALARAA